MIKSFLNPLSRIIPRPRPRRVPGRELMTIAVGLQLGDGLAIGADSLEAYGDYGKRHTPKLKDITTQDGQSSLIIAGAGDSTFIDWLIEKIAYSIEAAEHNIDAIKVKIEDTLIAQHQRIWPLYTAETRPDTRLLIGVST